MGITRFFKDAGVSAMCTLAGRTDDLEIDDCGVIAISNGIKPPGFNLIVLFPEGATPIVVQRDLTRHHGTYHQHFVADLGDNCWSMQFPIPVIRMGNNVWTPWQKPRSNKLDIWTLGKTGRLDLFQVGIVTHDNGSTFHLLGEYRWKGQLFYGQDRLIIGKPDDSSWGSFKVREEIVNFPEFREQIKGVSLAGWEGVDEELNPTLDPIPEDGYARVQWYSPFAGQTGQGPVILADGSPAWVHGADLLTEPDPDGIKRLLRNDLLKFAGTASFGERKREPKILSAEKVLAMTKA